MKYSCQYRVNKDMMLHLEADNQKEMFDRISEVIEVFGNWGVCGKCKDPDRKPRPVVRLNAKKQKFYELHCQNPDCRARFVFGQNQSTPTLFPQRKFPKSDQRAGEWKPDDGWVKYERGHEEEPDSEPDPSPPPRRK